MGNHELNLVEWRHERTDPKGSNKPTIADGEARRDLWEPVLDFFETLPLALELEDLRVTHAVWNQGCIEELRGLGEPAASHPALPDWASLVLLHSPYEGGNHRPEVPFHQYVLAWAPTGIRRPRWSGPPPDAPRAPAGPR